MANLISKDEYKVYEKLASDKDEVLIEQLITFVSSLVKTHCNNTFNDFITIPKVELFSIRTYNTEFLKLRETPITEVILVETRSGPEADYETFTSFEILAQEDMIECWSGYWPRGANSVRITYNAGYEEIPGDLKLAVMDLVTHYLKDEYKEKRVSNVSQINNPSSKNVLVNSISWPEHIRRVLALYRNV